MPNNPKKPAKRKRRAFDVDTVIEGLKDEAAIVDMEGNRITRGFRRFVRKQHAYGMCNRQSVWELHVKQGLTLTKVAEIMDLSIPRVCAMYREWREFLIANCPKTSNDFLAMREELNAQLDSVINDACADRKDSRMMAIRLKAIEQKARLYGLNLEQKADGDSDGVPYATPDEIAEAVQKRAMEMHGRAMDVAAARLALAQDTERDVTPA